jgi:hypothetical protein
MVGMFFGLLVEVANESTVPEAILISKEDWLLIKNSKDLELILNILSRIKCKKIKRVQNSLEKN